MNESIMIELVRGGFILTHRDTVGNDQREVHFTQRKLIARVKELVAERGLVAPDLAPGAPE